MWLVRIVFSVRPLIRDEGWHPGASGVTRLPVTPIIGPPTQVRATLGNLARMTRVSKFPYSPSWVRIRAAFVFATGGDPIGIDFGIRLHRATGPFGLVVTFHGTVATAASNLA